MIQLIDRIDRIQPRVGDRPAGKRQRRPFPPTDEADEPAEDTAERPSTEDPATPEHSGTQVDEDSEEHLVDITVLGRFLPGGQFLPGPGDAVAHH